MTTVIVTIADEPGNQLSLEGRIDNPDAMNQVPTAAVIVGAYLATNADRVCRDAVAWFNDKVAEQEQPQ